MIMRNTCVIVGAGTYGQVYAAYLSEHYKVLGFIDDDPSLANEWVAGIRVLGNSEYLFNEVSSSHAVFVPLGENQIRSEFLINLRNSGFDTPSFIHPQTIIHSSVQVGNAVYILPGTIIMPHTVLEDNVMVSVGVNIAHHVHVGRGSFFSQGCNIGASILIGDYAYFGIGSTIMTGISKVGRNSLIGAGTVVIRDVEDQAVMVGNPAKFLRYNEPMELKK